MQTDNGIDTLIDLNGNIVQQERGFWVEIHAWRVAPTILIPHGIRYSLTLHNQSGARVLGYPLSHLYGYFGLVSLSGRDKSWAKA